MDHIGRTWHRHQWSSGHDDVSPPTDRSQHAPWNRMQWVGQTNGRIPIPVPSDAPDPRSGFSGFGVPDTGGMRWAIGYRATDRRAAEAAPERGATAEGAMS
jgi:hypothetical protein